MPYHLMNLRHVPEDEAEEVRALFEEHEVIYYETPSSRWGISMGGFWANDPKEAERAKALLESYQRERSARLRAEFERDREAGRIPGFWQRLRQKPLTLATTFLAILIILAISLAPFVRF
ncbi:DUF6164 family protein [Marinobacter sp.]|uniref:DUF6164 family protein n=1 Tax=Marinobacter sp. TaxID=50741 RepID=UPI00384DAB13